MPQKRSIGVRLTWVRYRGAGAVTIDDFTKSVDGNGEASVTATFAEPGEYVLREGERVAMIPPVSGGAPLHAERGLKSPRVQRRAARCPGATYV